MKVKETEKEKEINKKLTDFIYLLAVSIIFNRIEKIENKEIKEMMKFVFTSAVPQMTKLMFVIKRRSKNNGIEKEELGSWVAGYWMPEDLIKSCKYP